MANVKSKPVHYGLYGENDFLLPDFIHCEPISFRTKMHNQVIKEHIHTSLFQVFIIESGNLDLFSENDEYVIVGPAIIVVPENTSHGWKTEKIVKGKVLTISTSFLETLFSNSSQALLELNEVHIITAFDKMNSFEAIQMFTDSIYHEMKKNLPEKKLVSQNYCNLLLSLICRLMEKKSDKLIVSDNRSLRYFMIFSKSVKQSCTPMKSISQYAHELNISRVHLNRVCQSVVGKSALQVIHEFLILEAEKFLQKTELQVSEIAYRLNFEDPAYFSRLFRKYTGTCPKEFRQRN